MSGIPDGQKCVRKSLIVFREVHLGAERAITYLLQSADNTVTDSYNYNTV